MRRSERSSAWPPRRIRITTRCAPGLPGRRAVSYARIPGYVMATGVPRTSDVSKMRRRSRRSRKWCAKLSKIIAGESLRDPIEDSDGGLSYPEAHGCRALSRGTVERERCQTPSVERMPEGSCARCDRCNPSNSAAGRVLHHVCLPASGRESAVHHPMDEY